MTKLSKHAEATYKWDNDTGLAYVNHPLLSLIRYENQLSLKIEISQERSYSKSLSVRLLFASIAGSYPSVCLCSLFLFLCVSSWTNMTTVLKKSLGRCLWKRWLQTEPFYSHLRCWFSQFRHIDSVFFFRLEAILHLTFIKAGYMDHSVVKKMLKWPMSMGQLKLYLS